MLNKFKNFSKSKLGAVVVFIVALPFVFFGMGSVFQNKDTNNIAKIDNYNISTKNFINHISSLGISSEVIRNNLDQNILEEILSDLLAKKFIELEIDYYDISISDKQLVKIIKKNKNFPLFYLFFFSENISTKKLKLFFNLLITSINMIYPTYIRAAISDQCCNNQ